VIAAAGRAESDLTAAAAVPGVTGAAQLALGAILIVLVVLFVVVAVRRMTALAFDRRRARLVAQTRPLLLQLLTDDDPAPGGGDPESVRRLAQVKGKLWRACEPGVVAMLGKVRGGPRDALVALLEERGTIDRARRGTRSYSAVTRCRSAEMLGATGVHDSIPLLVPLLSDRQSEVRQVATRALGKVGAAEAAAPLLEAVSGPHAVPPREVSAAIVVLEPEADAVIMQTASGSDDPQIRAVAAEVLGLRGAVDASRMLVDQLVGDESREVKVRSARALGRIGAPTAVKPLQDALTTPWPELRAVSARALGQLGAPGSVPALVACLDDPSHRVCSNAAESLTALGDVGRAALRTVSESGSQRATAYAIEALALDGIGRRQLERVGI
jgi:HEAT repeat protein